MQVIGYTRDAGFGDSELMSGSLAPRFFWDFEDDPSTKDETGYCQKKKVAKIELYQDNGLTKMVDKVWEDKEIPSADRDWKRRFAPFWRAFMEGSEERQIIGIPIEELFRNNPAKAEYYKRFNVFTVEQLANTSDGNINGLGMGAMSDREAAKKYIDARKEGAVFEALAKEKEALEAKNQALEEEQAAMKKRMDDMMAQMSILTEALTKKEEVADKSAKRK